MADPATLAIGSMASTAVGGILGAFGSAYKGEAQANMYNYQAGIAGINQQIALQNADYERHTGEVQAEISGMKSRAQIGQITAAQAGSGLDINRGSPAAVRSSQTEIAQQDEAMIRANAIRRAYGYETEAVQDKAQAEIDRMAATTSRTAGDIGALTSILGGGTSVADKWLQYQTKFG